MILMRGLLSLLALAHFTVPMLLHGNLLCTPVFPHVSISLAVFLRTMCQLLLLYLADSGKGVARSLL